MALGLLRIDCRARLDLLHVADQSAAPLWCFCRLSGRIATVMRIGL